MKKNSATNVSARHETYQILFILKFQEIDLNGVHLSHDWCGISWINTIAMVTGS